MRVLTLLQIRQKFLTSDYYRAISTGAWSLPPATLDLHIYISGTQEQVHDTIKYAELLLALSDRDPDPPRRVKQI